MAEWLQGFRDWTQLFGPITSHQVGRADAIVTKAETGPRNDPTSG